MMWSQTRNRALMACVGLLLVGSLGSYPAPAPIAQAQTPAVKVIFDTDMGIDEDDCGALAVLHKLADYGEAEIIAMGSSSNVFDSHSLSRVIDGSTSTCNTR